jgi:Flp pilus assembly protein protease CpaA
MNISHILFQIQYHLLIHGAQYKFYIEIATVAVLFYIGLTDFRTSKIRNDVVLLLLVLYILFALISRSWFEILWNVVLAAVMFGVLLWFFANRAVGGGDVKLIPVVCLWVGIRCALLYSAFLLLFVGLHLVAARMGWAQTKQMAGRSDRYAIPYAPSVAGALISIIMLGCV